MDSTYVTVILNEAPIVVAGDYVEEMLCELSSVCFPVEVSDINNNIYSITVFPFGDYNPLDGTVCFTPSGEGIYQFIVTAIDACGEIAQDSVTVEISLNSTPTASLGSDISVSECDEGYACIPFSYDDIDSNIAIVEVIGAEYTGDNNICMEI